MISPKFSSLTTKRIKMLVLILCRFITSSNQNHSCIGPSLRTSLYALSVGYKGVTHLAVQILQIFWGLEWCPVGRDP